MTEPLSITTVGPERLDELEPLWNALHAYHCEIAPRMGHAPARSVAESWRLGRAKYERWLEDPDTFVLLAERAEQAVGYAFVTVGGGFSGWGSGERLAELQALSVLPGHRGQGIGSALMDAVYDRVAGIGVADLTLRVAVANEAARAFYERRGLRPAFEMLLGRVEETGRAAQ